MSGETAAYQYAADAIRKLNREGVDPDVISLAREIVGWYHQGIANSHAAESLLQSADIASRKASPARIGKRPKNSIANNACKSTATANNCANR